MHNNMTFFVSFTSRFYEPDKLLWLVTCCFLLFYDTRIQRFTQFGSLSWGYKDQNMAVRVHIERGIEG